MQAYSEKLLFNMASQNMDAEAALKLAEKLGLVDQRTIAAYKSVEFLTQKYDLNEDGVISNAEATQGYNEAIVNLSGSLGTSSGSMETNTGNAGRLGSALRRAAVDASILGQELRNASGNYSATFDIYVRKHGTISLPDPPGPQPPPGWTPPPPTGPPPGGHPDHPTGGQHGLNMVVPPGYPDDSFPILTTSGERVIVLTSAQQKAGGMTSSGNISIVRPVKTGGTMGPVGSIFGGPDPISNFLPNWVEAIGDAGDDLTDASDTFVDSSTTFADDMTDITTDFANDINWTTSGFASDMTATGNRFADDSTVVISDFANDINWTTDSFAGDMTGITSGFANDINWTTTGFAGNMNVTAGRFAGDMTVTSGKFSADATSLLAQMAATIDWFARSAVGYLAQIANAFANIRPPAPVPPPTPPPTPTPPAGIPMPKPPTPPADDPGTWGGPGHLPPADDPGTWNGPPKPKPGDRIPLYEQNVLIVNTNAPVDTDISELTLLRAWASG
jgi:hypothetical protein